MREEGKAERDDGDGRERDKYASMHGDSVPPKTHRTVLPPKALHGTLKAIPMEWLRSHPYIDALLGAAALILLGIFIVGQRTPVGSENTAPLAWGGAGVHLLDPISNVPDRSGDMGPQNLYTQVRGGPPFNYSPASSTPVPANTSAGDFDFDAFIAMLSTGDKPSSGGSQTSADTSLDIYSFIPGGLISTSTPEKELTPAQEELHNYGNEAGSSIQSFEDSHRNMARTLKDQFEDPQDPGKVAALEGLGDALARVGRELEGMGNVPESARSVNASVAKSYREMGEMLALVPEAHTDDERVSAMLAYNATVDTYIKNYVALATLFSAHGVTFASNESGSVFVFTSAGF
jgi:hypothetical protein